MKPNEVALFMEVSRERDFYREQLELIGTGKRNTKDKRLAQSALTFWDAMKNPSPPPRAWKSSKP